MNEKRVTIVRELALVAGLATAAAGVAAYDWRAALIAVGLVLSVASLRALRPAQREALRTKHE